MREKVLKRISCFALVLFILYGCSQKNVENNTLENIFKSDYIEASKILANKYIYLDRKLGISREEFITTQLNYADNIIWDGGKEQFIDEIVNLLSKMNDSHIHWSIPKELYLKERYKILGFILTVSKDKNIIVGEAFEYFQKKLTKGDEIISINDISAYDVIEEFSKLHSNSSELAGIEKAARLYGFYLRDSPLRKSLKPYKIKYKNSEGLILEDTFKIFFQTGQKRT